MDLLYPLRAICYSRKIIYDQLKNATERGSCFSRRRYRLVKFRPCAPLLGFLLFAVAVEGFFNGHAGVSA